jgi:hypothetical protein
MNRDFAMPRSFRRLLVVAAALLALAAPAFAAAATDPADPRAPVAALYAAEKSGRPTLVSPDQRAAALTRGLAAMWDKAEARAHVSGDIAIDFDVVTNSQGAEVKSYALTIERRDATHATVVATIDPGDRAGLQSRLRNLRRHHRPCAKLGEISSPSRKRSPPSE